MLGESINLPGAARHRHLAGLSRNAGTGMDGATETGNGRRTQACGEARLAADIFRYFGGLAGELRAHWLFIIDNPSGTA